MKQNGKYRFLFASALFTGNEAFFMNLKDALGTLENVEISWVPVELSPGEWFARVPPVSMNFSLKNALVARSRIRALEREGKKFDAAFINHVTPAHFLSGFMKRVPTVLSLDVTPCLLDRYSKWYETESVFTELGFLEKVKRAQTRQVYQRSARLLPWSDLAKESLVTEYGIDRRKIVVIPPGIDLRLWPAHPARNGVQARSLPLKILFVGGHFLRKGGDLLLRVAQRPEFQKCQFHLVTKSYAGPELANVIVHPNISPNSEPLRQLYREADIFAFPTRADFSPLAVCEAAATGLPVVSTDAGALGELVDDGSTGFVVPVDDEVGFADRLLKLSTDSSLRARMALNARTKSERSFDLKRNAGAIIEMMKELARTPKTPLMRVPRGEAA